MTKIQVLLFTLLLTGGINLSRASSSSAFFDKSQSIEVMTWNVENLFDTLHDEGKNDWTFLPSNTPGKNEECAKITNRRYREECFETDWDDEKLDLKLEQIKEVLTRDRSYLPDVLALSEIENENVISLLANKVGYSNFTVSNSPDERGVDLALLWNDQKLKMVSRREHVIKSKALEGRPTRNILEVEFLVNGKEPLTVFVNHWPSQGNKNESRIDAAKTLMKRVKKIRRKNKKMAIVATGDFNVITTNRPDPFYSVVEKKGLIDVHGLFMKSKDIDDSVKSSYPLGTYFYGRNIDRFFISKNLTDGSGLDLELKTYRIHAPKFMTTTYEYTDDTENHYGSIVMGTPKRCKHVASSPASAGYSDHFPVVMKLKY